MRSMTGFGTAIGKVGRGRVFVEARTINHRYCDMIIKVPPKFGGLEVLMREFIRQKFERGRIEIFIKELQNVWGNGDFRPNLDLAKRYIKTVKKLRRDLNLAPLEDPLEKADYSSLIIHHEKITAPNSLWPDLKKVLNAAIEGVDRMRLQEGRYLLKDQLEHLNKLNNNLKAISKKSRANEKARVSTSTPPSLEIAKQDITEEITRLSCHVQQYKKLLYSKETAGRKLDFLIQEMNREFNTIGAKACDAKVSQFVVEAKSEMERLREQVQNLE